VAASVGEKEDGVNGINITPLVDVCLVLVLIFMVTMPLSLLRGIDVKRQSLSKYGLSTPQENVNARLTSRELFIKDEKGVEKAIPFDEAAAVLGGVLQSSTGKRFFLRVEREVSHGRTVWVMDVAKQNGAADISLME
jgi:biopolymer transport protein ExbD